MAKYENGRIYLSDEEWEEYEERQETLYQFTDGDYDVRPSMSKNFIESVKKWLQED